MQLVMMKSRLKRFLSLALCFLLLSGLFLPQITYAAPKYVLMNTKKVGINLGDTYNLSNGVPYAVYMSKNPKIATVSADGTVTGVKVGTTTIISQLIVNGKTRQQSCKVYVEKPYISVSSLYMNQNTSFKLSMKKTKFKPKWETSNRFIALVDNNGKVTGVGTGKCTITATLNRNTYTCDVVVETPAPKEVSLKLGVGDTRLVKILHTEQIPIWKSSAKKIVSVDQFGKITALKKGSAVISCKLNRKTYKIKVRVVKNLPIHDHLWSEKEVVLQPTCSENGLEFWTCEYCGEVSENTLLALGHEFSEEWTVDVAPTCSENGIKSHHCIRCSIVSEETVIPATGHTYDDGVVIKEPTCTVSGMKRFTCRTCGYQREETIEPLGHAKELEWTIDKRATCTEDGSKSHHCSTCGEHLDITTIPAHGHDISTSYIENFIEGYLVKKCNICGEIAEQDPITYTIKYHGNGAEGEISDTECTYDETETLKDVSPLNGEESFQKENSHFLGWNTSSDASFANFYNKEHVKNLSISNNDVIDLYAIWSENDAVPFKVVYELMNEDGYSYSEYLAQTLYGNADSIVEFRPRYISGYTTPEEQSVRIAADGTTEIVFQYHRPYHHVFLEKNTGIRSVTGEDDYMFGITVSCSAVPDDGYSFDHWSGDFSSSNITNVFNMLTHDITLTAHAKPISYSIIYNLNDGTLANPNPESYDIETDTFVLNNPTKEGYVFKGWTGTEHSDYDKNLTIYKGTYGTLQFTANWEEITDTYYTVRHYKMNTDGKTYLLADTDSFESEVNAKETPATRSYIGFTSPATQTVTVKDNGSSILNYYYIRNQYSLSLTKGVGVRSIDGNGTYYYGEKVRIDASLLDGYSFDEWSGTLTITQKQYEITMPANPITLTATGKCTEYPIHYDLQDGKVSGHNPDSYTVDDSTQLINPTKDGYTFLGWTGSCGNTPLDNVSIPKGSSGELTYTANWKENEYSIAYQSNGGFGIMLSNTVNYSEEVTLPENTFQYSGRVFLGWGTNPHGPVLYEDGAIVSKLTTTDKGTVTLYAIWKDGFGVGSKICDTETGFTFTCVDLSYEGGALMVCDSVIPCNGYTSSPVATRCPVFAEFSGTYADSLVRSWINNVYIPALGEDLKSRMLPVTIDGLTDDVFLLSFNEISEYREYTLKEWVQASGCWGYWSRTAYWNTTSNMYSVYYAGANNIAVTDIGVKPAFVLDLSTIEE